VTIFVDMDMVLVDFYGFSIEHARKYNSEVDFADDHLQEESTARWIKGNGTIEEGRRLKERIWNTYSFWEDMPFLPNAERVFKWLYETFDVYIATSAFLSNSEICIVGKYRWVQKHLPYFPLSKFIYFQHKRLLRGDYIIDDMNWFLDDFCGDVITMDYPYNRHHETPYRVKNWLEIEGLFKKI